MGMMILIVSCSWCLCVFIASKIYFKWGRDRPSSYRVRIGDEVLNHSNLNSEANLVTNSSNVQIADTGESETSSNANVPQNRVSIRPKYIYKSKLKVDQFFPSCKYSTMKM